MFLELQFWVSGFTERKKKSSMELKMIVHLNWDYIDNAFFPPSFCQHLFSFLPQFQDFISRNLGWKQKQQFVSFPRTCLCQEAVGAPWSRCDVKMKTFGWLLQEFRATLYFCWISHFLQMCWSFGGQRIWLLWCWLVCILWKCWQNFMLLTL